MAQSSGESKFTLRLVVDEEKNKVVFAEACSDFVDVLFSLLTLPMGTIVRLLEDHRKERVTVDCFSNLYKSVVDMDIDHFETDACKEMLMHPRSMKEVQCKRLKRNLHPTEDVKYFLCSFLSSCKMYSNFSTSRCQCGRLMNKEIQGPKVKAVENRQDGDNGVFISGRSAFIITDDLKVAVKSTDLILKKLESLGCGDVSKLGEKLVDVGYDKVLKMLECILSSNALLTDAFLNKESPQGTSKINESLSPCMEKSVSEAELDKVITVDAIVRKQDKKVLYVECGEDFVDLLLTFLAVPLESVMEISGNSSTLGCIGNLFNSFKDLSATQVSTSKSVLPHYYRCRKQLLDITTDQPPSNKAEPGVLIDPKLNGGNQTTEGSGFVKKDTKFTVTDDLTITPMNSSSTFCLLKKLHIQAKDLVVQEISITKTEATSLLRASLLTSSALNVALGNLTLKKPKEEI